MNERAQDIVLHQRYLTALGKLRAAEADGDEADIRRLTPAVERLWQLYSHDMSDVMGTLPNEEGSFKAGRLPTYFEEERLIGKERLKSVSEEERMHAKAEAATAYRAAIQRNTAYAVAHNGLGVALARLKQWDEALAAYTKATKIDPRYPEPHSNIGTLLAKQHKLDAAIEANFGTPVPALGANLATALANRELQSLGNLNCGNFGLTNPITAQLDGNGVLLSATYNTNAQTAKVPGGATGGNVFPGPGRFGNPMAGPRHN